MSLRIVDRKTKEELARSETLRVELLALEAQRCATLRGHNVDESARKFLEKAAQIKARLTTARETDDIAGKIEKLIRSDESSLLSQGQIDINKLLDLL